MQMHPAIPGGVLFCVCGYPSASFRVMRRSVICGCATSGTFSLMMTDLSHVILT